MEMPVGTALPVGLLQALVIADGYQCVLEPVAVRYMVVNIVGRDGRHAISICQIHQPPYARCVPLDQIVL